MDLPDKMTIGEIADRACKITDQAEADAYVEALIERAVRLYGQSREEAESIIRHNFGYWGGYCSDETRARLERLFKTKHPIFGAIADGKPSADEAFEMGIAYSKR